MEDTAPLIFFIGGVALVILWLMNSSKQEKIATLESEEKRLRRKHSEEISRLTKEKRELTEFKQEATARLKKSNERQRHLLRLIQEKNKQFPWLATAFGDYQNYLTKMEEARLLNKKRPAPKAKEAVNEAGQRAREAEKNFRRLKYRIDFYEKYFPWLTEVTGDTLEELLDAEQPETIQAEGAKEDPVRQLLATQEYDKLSSVQRNQLALDRWKGKRKSNSEVGRLYERYVGYTYEKRGYHVSYFGATQGVDDLGRDLIVRKGGDTRIVQCKYWSKNKAIHEKHVFQLFGSVVEYIARANRSGNSLPLFGTFERLSDIRPVFVTSTCLSEKAREFSRLLEVEVHENFPLGEYPLIKCNVSRTSGEKVYHLPFDQQYDRTVIEPSKGELYEWTAAEAEQRGFRRAFRWRPEKRE